MFKGHLDAAPIASVLFCLLIFVMLGTLVYTPGVTINLPPDALGDSPGVDGPVVSIAVDKAGQYYFENQVYRGTDLEKRLADEVQKSSTPLTLVIEADKDLSLEKFGAALKLGKAAGITSFKQAVLPGIFDAPHQQKPR